MKVTRAALLVLVFVSFCLSPASSPAQQEAPQTAATAIAPEIDKPAPDFSLADTGGKTHSLSSLKGKYVVLEWTNFDCPFVRKHYDSGNMQKLQEAYTARGVVWLRVCSSAEGKQGHYAARDVDERIAEEKSRASAYLVDASGEVGRLYNAKTTPHMFVVNPQGTLVYAGAIDDKPSTKADDVKGATNYVAAALEAALAGKPVEVKTSTPYGCSVKYADKK
jgi:peroxiredoxin